MGAPAANSMTEVVVAAAAHIRASELEMQAMAHPDLRELEAVAPPAMGCEAMLFR